MESVSRELKLAKSLALKAGKLTLKYFNKPSTGYELKGPSDFLTIADKESEKLIVEGIRRKFPKHAILGEEGASFEGSDGEKTKWIIDPVDGTAPFANGVPWYTVSIGVERNGELFTGAVYAPVTKMLFYAEKGKGAYLNGERLSMNPKREFPDIVTICEWGNTETSVERGIKAYNYFEKIGLTTFAPGATTLDLCYLAAGKCDAAICCAGKAWDYAASTLIAREAGAVVTDYLGNAVNVHEDKPVIGANNENLHKLLLEKCRNLWEERTL